jgi:hypothetical protein
MCLALNPVESGHIHAPSLPTRVWGYLLSCRLLDTHGHTQRPVVVFAIDVVQVGVGVAQNAVTDTAVVSCLFRQPPPCQQMPSLIITMQNNNDYMFPLNRVCVCCKQKNRQKIQENATEQCDCANTCWLSGVLLVMTCVLPTLEVRSIWKSRSFNFARSTISPWCKGSRSAGTPK